MSKRTSGSFRASMKAFGQASEANTRGGDSIRARHSFGDGPAQPRMSFED